MMGKKSSKLKRLSKSYCQDDGLNVSKAEADKMCRYQKLHNGSIVSVDAFKSGQCLSGGEDGTLVTFDPINGNISRNWAGHSRGITKVLCSESNGQEMMFTSSRDKAVKQWRFGADCVVQSFNGHSLVVSGIACSPDGKMLMSGSRDNTVCLWDVESGQLIKSTNLARNIVADMKWCGDTGLCAQTGEDKILKLWDSRTVSVAKSFPIKQYFQICVDCSDDGRYIATGSTGFNGSGCEVLLWDVREGQVLQEFKGHTQKVSSCRLGKPFGSGDPWIVTASTDCSIKVWRPGNAECILTEIIGATRELTCLAFVGDNRITVGSLDFGAYHMKLGGNEYNPSFQKLSHFCL